MGDVNDIEMLSARGNILPERKGVLTFSRCMLDHDFMIFDWPLEHDNGIDEIGIATLPGKNNYTPIATSCIAGFQLKSTDSKNPDLSVPIGSHRACWGKSTLPIFAVKITNTNGNIYVEDTYPQTMTDEGSDSDDIATEVMLRDAADHIWLRTVAWSLCRPLGVSLRKQTLRNVFSKGLHTTSIDPLTNSIWSYIASTFLMQNSGLEMYSWNECMSFFRLMDLIFGNTTLLNIFYDELKLSKYPQASNAYAILYLLLEKVTDLGKYLRTNNTLDQEIVIDGLDGNISGGKRFEEAVNEDYLYALSVLRKYWESSIKQLGITYQDLAKKIIDNFFKPMEIDQKTDSGNAVHLIYEINSAHKRRAKNLTDLESMIFACFWKKFKSSI